MNSRWIVVLALGIFALLAVAAGFYSDAAVRSAVVASQGKNWKKSPEGRFHQKVRVWGDWPALMGYSAAGLLAARLARSRKWIRILLAAAIASTLAGIVANASRLTTGRTRPKESPKIEQGFYGPWKDGKLLIGQPAYNSFPSGHTATAFGLAVVILLASPLWGIPALLGAGLVAWSSIVTGNHHPSDVVVSVILASLIAWLVWRRMQAVDDRRIDRCFRIPSP